MSKHRDVGSFLQILRDILLGRKHTLHCRFADLQAPRTIPPPEIPRSPEYKLAKMDYYSQSSQNAVKPPVVAPIGEGPAIDQDPTAGYDELKTSSTKAHQVRLCKPCIPGQPWWWDGHSNAPSNCKKKV